MAVYEGSGTNDDHVGTNDADLIRGNAGADKLQGGDGADQIEGGIGNDVLAGDAGGDTLDGGDGNDTLYSAGIAPPLPYPEDPFAPPPPLLDRGSEVDVLRGGAGWDTIYAGYGDTVDGQGNGATLFISLQGAQSGQTIDFSALATGSLTVGGGTWSNITRVDWVEGSEFDDVLTAAATLSPLFGMGGNDRLVGNVQTRLMFGGAGDDRLEGGGGGLVGGDGDDIITSALAFCIALGDDGTDTIVVAGSGSGGSGNDTITINNAAIPNDGYPYPANGFGYGDEGDDTVTGSDAQNTLAGGTGSDILHGNGGNDLLLSTGAWIGFYTNKPDWFVETDVGAERDQLFGGAGDDRVSVGYGDDADGGTGSDALILTLAGATAGIDLDLGGLVGAGALAIGGGAISGFESVAQFSGTDFADTITINAATGRTKVFGLAGNDTIYGTADGDTIHGGLGADLIQSGDGNDSVILDSSQDVVGDVIDGGSGSDSLRTFQNSGIFDLSTATLTSIEWLATSGSSRFVVTAAQLAAISSLSGRFQFAQGGTIALGGITGSSTSFYLADAGNRLDLTGFLPDTLVAIIGAAGDDRLIGSTARDNATGGGGNDALAGNGGDDTLDGEGGNDVLDGGVGADVLRGGVGDDRYVVDDAGDAVFENAGEGADSVESSIGYSLDAAGRVGVENITLTGAAAIDATGNALANRMTGNAAANLLEGRDGNDTLNGGGGDDRLDGGEGGDNLNGGAGADTMIGGAGNDVYVVDNLGDLVTEAANGGTADSISLIVAAGSSYTLADHVERLVVMSNAVTATGNALANLIINQASGGTLRGEGGDDSLIGAAGAETLDGGTGNDVMKGGQGNDLYRVDSAVDVLIELAGEGVDIVEASIGWTLGAEFENLVLRGSDAINGTGNALANTITGNGVANLLAGMGGNDTLNGVGGDDRLDGGDGSDTLNGGAGADAMAGGTGNDVYVVDSLADVVTEAANGGTADSISLIVAAGSSYTLADHVERLVVMSNNIAATGNALANIISTSGTGTTLDGGAGNDVLTGSAGSDILQGGADDDLLKGGAGNDLFVFAPGSGRDTIADFTRAADRIDLAAYGIADFDALAAMISQQGGDTLIDIGGGGTIRLTGVDSTTLAASDFVLAEPAPAALFQFDGF